MTLEECFLNFWLLSLLIKKLIITCVWPELKIKISRNLSLFFRDFYPSSESVRTIQTDSSRGDSYEFRVKFNNCKPSAEENWGKTYR